MNEWIDAKVRLPDRGTEVEVMTVLPGNWVVNRLGRWLRKWSETHTSHEGIFSPPPTHWRRRKP